MEDVRATQETFHRDVFRLWTKYTRHSTVHGVNYASSPNGLWPERLLWILSLICAFCGMVVMCKTLLDNASASPTGVAITNTHLQLYLFAFPAVSLCPVNKIRRSVGEALLLKHLGVSEAPNATLQQEVRALMRTLSKIDMPDFSGMAAPLRSARRILPLLGKLNITDFMLQSMPRCEDLFGACVWHGIEEPCCDLLTLQESTSGYCYSFNSLTAFRSKDCEVGSASLNSLHAARATISNPDATECQLRRTTSFGGGNGLQIFFKAPLEDNVVDGSGGVEACVHYATGYPQPNSGYRIQSDAWIRLSISLTVENTVVSQDVRLLPITTRNCVMVTERELWVAETYSTDSCQLQCRLEEIFRLCKCIPYLFGGKPVCGVAQLECLSNVNNLATFLPPAGALEGVPYTGEGLNCSYCLPNCQVVSYQTQPSISRLDGHPRMTAAGLVDVHYRDLGAAKLYHRSKSISTAKTITFVGSAAGLCLGMSILSVVETGYYFLKLLNLVVVHFFQLRRLSRIRFRKREQLRRQATLPATITTN